MMTAYVFISYSRTDRDYAQMLAAFLQGAGIPVWFDYEIQTGDRFGQKIQAAIDEAAVFITLVTRASVASEWVGREISYAGLQKKPIVPIRLDDCAIPIEIAFLDCLDVRNGQLPPPRFVDHLRVLVGAGDTPLQPDRPAARDQAVVAPSPQQRAPMVHAPKPPQARSTKAIWATAIVVLLAAGGVGGWVAWTRITDPSRASCLFGRWAPVTFEEKPTSIGGASVQLTGPGPTRSYSTDGTATIDYGQPGLTYTARVGGHRYERTFSGFVNSDYRVDGNHIVYTHFDNSHADYLDSVDARIVGQGATKYTDFTATFTCTGDTLIIQTRDNVVTSSRQA